MVIYAGCVQTAKKYRFTQTTKQKDYRVHEPELEDELVQETKSIVGDPEFHYTGKYCTECHEQTPKRGENNYLIFNGDYNLLCRCHLKTPNSYIHPTDMKPSYEKRTKIPVDFPLQDGKVTCLTCHDIYRQCQKREVDRFSLRGMPYRKTTEFCFKCHDQRSYVMLDPHEQLDKKGDIVIEKCLYCHTEILDEKRADFDDPKLIGDIGVLCQRCHIRMAMRSGSFNHMKRPSGEILASMKKSEEEHGVILPLDAQGKTTCATCHNPHDKGVISADRPAARGAGSQYRLRLPDGMCMACHLS